MNFLRAIGGKPDKHVEHDEHGKPLLVRRSKDKEMDEPRASNSKGEGTDKHRASKSKGKGIDEHYCKSDPLPPSGKTPANRAHKNRPPHLHETKGRCRPRKKMYEEAKRYVSVDKGKPYPCTKEDLDACGGEDRQVSSIRVRDKDDLRALWFQKPNERPKATIQKAALDIHNHNALGRSPSAEEDEAIDHLGAMIEKANQGSWGPEVVIKCFCDLDTVFFRGKLRDHVCVSWALNNREFPESQTFGNSEPLGHGKAWIILNAQVMFLDSHQWD